VPYHDLCGADCWHSWHRGRPAAGASDAYTIENAARSAGRDYKRAGFLEEHRGGGAAIHPRHTLVGLGPALGCVESAQRLDEQVHLQLSQKQVRQQRVRLGAANNHSAGSPDHSCNEYIQNCRKLEGGRNQCTANNWTMFFLNMRINKKEKYFERLKLIFRLN